MQKPNFFIVGASKSGTTALYNYLKAHPEIFLTEPKEPKFFGSDLPFKKDNFDNKIERYLSLFSTAKKQKRLGEASTNYLYSTMAAKEIKEFSPDAKIIIMLRNPVDQMYSRHSQLLSLGAENIQNFKKALVAEKKREKQSKSDKWSRILLYRKVASYYKQVKRYSDLFGCKNVHIVIFDDFVKDTAKAYTDVLGFLQVDTNFKPDFEKLNTSRVRNPNKTLRNWRIQNILYQPPSVFKKLAKKHKLISKTGQHLHKYLTRVNTRYIKRNPMSPQLRRELTKEVTPEIKRLSRLIRRDLSSWYQ